MAKKPKARTSHGVFHGKEPSWVGKLIGKENYQSELSTGLNYYATIPLKDRKKWFVKWAKDQGKTAKELSGIPTDYLFTISSMARMDDRGFPFDKTDQLYMTTKLNWMLETYPAKEVAVDPSVDYMKDFAREQAQDVLMGIVMEQFDAIVDAQITDKKQLKSPDVDMAKLNVGQKQEVYDYYNKHLIEVKLVYNKADQDLMEGYVGVARVQLSRVMKLYVSILEVIQKQQLLAQAKKPRKARSRKVKTAQELTKKLKYLPSHEEYGIMSINPEKLVGCSEAWILNTKNRKLQYYYSDIGITVKGTTLQNFLSGSSSQKTIRKPKEFIADLLKQPKVRSQKLYANVNSKASTCNGRINEHCVILKVY